MLMSISLANDCEFGEPEWVTNYETVPFDNEFSATSSCTGLY